MVNHDNLIIEKLSIKDSNLIGYKILDCNIMRYSDAYLSQTAL